jgi:hypothetical protein
MIEIVADKAKSSQADDYLDISVKHRSISQRNLVVISTMGLQTVTYCQSAMKSSSCVALIFSLAINGANAFHQQPAMGGQLPGFGHIAEALTTANNPSSEESDNLILAQMGDKYGYKDAAGKIVISARFDNAYEFFDGLAAVRVNGKWGFIDRSGKPIGPMQFENATSFNDGFAAVKLGGKWGFINDEGEMEIAPTFEDAETFSEGLAKVRIGNKWGFIDEEGAIAIKPIYDEVASFNDSTAWVRIGKQVGYINEAGKFLQ